MEIFGLAAAIPRRKIGNEEILDMVRYHSRYLSTNEQNNIVGRIRDGFNKTGTKNRYWRLGREKPLDLIRMAFDKAIRNTGIGKNEIDAVIYCSIHRGFMEPPTASIICKRLDIKCNHAFDVLDACMGWSTSVDIANKYISSGEWNNVVIIASEFPNDKGGAIVPSCFTYKDVNELDFKFAGLTMGEGASVTFLRKGEKPAWNFLRYEQPEGAHLCTVPLFNHSNYSEQSHLSPKWQGHSFSAFSEGMSSLGFRRAVTIMREFIQKYDEPEIIIPHAVSDVLPKRAANLLKINPIVVSTYPEFGNLSSASIPISLLSAINRDDVTTGNRIAGWVASAGMKHCAYSIHVDRSLFKEEG